MSETHNEQEAPARVGHHRAGAVPIENGKPVLAYEPDMAAEIDGGPDLEDGIDYAKLAQGFRENLRWCFVTNTGRTRRMKYAFLRFVALTAVLYPEAFNNATYSQISGWIKMPQERISEAASELSSDLRVRFRRSRPKSKS